jgi:hypothetical protein
VSVTPAISRPQHTQGGGYGYGWDGPYLYGYEGGGSCFAECLTAGYSPAYCSANSWQFC